MNQYLLTTYSVEGEPQGPPPSPEDMQQFMHNIIELEADMETSGAFVFGGALHGSDGTRVVRQTDADVMVTDGPFAETKEQMGGFYIINAQDLETAVDWASKVTNAIGRPIEVRTFSATGKAADHMG